MKWWALALMSLFIPNIVMADSLFNDTVTVNITNNLTQSIDCSDIQAVDALTGEFVPINDDLSGVTNIGTGQTGQLKADVGSALFDFPWNGYVTCKYVSGGEDVAKLQWFRDPGTSNGEDDWYEGTPDISISVNPPSQTPDPPDSSGDMHMGYTISP